jgi:hypothetical protein
MKTKLVRQGSIDLMVKIIDWSPINKKISESVGQEVECRIGKALIENVEAIFDKEYDEVEIKSLITDTECCGRATETRCMYVSELNDGKPFEVNVIPDVGFYKVSKTNENGGFSVAMFPSYHFDIDIDDVKNCLTGEEIPLYQFMGSRYGYNPRISGNEMDFLKLVYFNQMKEGNRGFMSEKEMEIWY